MQETPIFKGPLPELSDVPHGPAQISAAVEWVEAQLAKIEKLILNAPAPGDLIVVDGTSDPVYRAITGDVTFNSGGVTTIGAGKVLEAMLGGEAVATAKIKALAVTAAKIAAEAVETGKIAASAVTEAKLANLAVTAAKLANEAVETGKIKAAAVTTAKIAAEAVTTALIKDGAVTDPKLASPNNAVYRTLLTAHAWMAFDNVGHHMLVKNGTVWKGLKPLDGPPPAFIRFDPAEYAVGGKTAKLRLQAQVAWGSVPAALPATVTLALYSLSMAGGSNYLMGEALAASQVAIGQTSTNKVVAGASGDFELAAGNYVIGAHTEAALGVPLGLATHLQIHHV